MEGFNPQAISQVAQILSKYSRTQYYDKTSLAGDDLAPGVAKQTSPGMEDMNKLINEAQSIDADFGNAIKYFFTDSRSGSLKTSSGGIAAAEKAIASLR